MSHFPLILEVLIPNSTKKLNNSKLFPPNIGGLFCKVGLLVLASIYKAE